jgi:GNAT superfamily N-acetyltransferase
MNLESTEKLNGSPVEGVSKIEFKQKHTPPSYQVQIAMLDGSQAEIRPILCADRNALLAFHSRLSDETRYLRYHYSKGELTEADLRAFCDLDYFNDLALVVEKERSGKKEIIGVGRYYRLPDHDTAEVSFVVQDNEQRKGIGTLLVKHLAILAWQRNIRYFAGEVFRTNAKMLNIFRKCDPDMTQVSDTTTCDIKLSVREAMNWNPHTK